MNSKMDSRKSLCLVKLAHILIFLFFFVSGAFGTTITVVNNCDFTVWPAVSGTPGFKSTGLELKQNNSRSFQVTESWDGVLWGRTNCTVNKLGQWSCLTGDCGSNEMECYGRKATPPHTEASFSLNQFKGNDSYDVSLIENYNLPMTVEATGGSGPCQRRGCRTWCLGSSASNWCQGADYTVSFCTPADLYKFSILKLGQLESTNQLLSLNGLFTLGFFGEDYSYLGIWYTNDSQSRKVWVANPKTPIMSSSMDHALSIDPDTGNLIIAAQNMNPISITDIQVGPNPNVTTTFQDTGNFLLINKIDGSVLWQSFDHPTNILLPGMKLGTNRKTGQNLTLTSWLTDEIPKEGAFTLSWEPTDEASQRLMIRRRGQPYWTSGNLHDQTFPYLFALNSYYKAFSVYNNTEQYFTYYKIYDSNDNAFPMLVLTPEGKIIDGNNSIVWTPEFCYGYSSGNGCVESGLTQCRRKGDTFRETNERLAPDFSRSAIDDNSSLSINDCFFRCWNDCDCVGFYSSPTNGTGCVIWTGSNSYFVKPNDSYTSMYVISSLHLPSSQNHINPTTGKKTKNNRNWIWIIIVAIPLIFFSLGLLWYLKQRKHIREEEERRRRDKYFLELTASESFKDVHQLESNGGKGNDLLIFSFASIMAATCDFSIENKLGQGGFGPVYKGTLIDGQEIAIKRLSRTSDQGLVEFKNELVLIAKLQHTNLVRILGCCIHGEEKMLIYEYMPNKSLDFFVFDENRKVELDWLKRFNIIEGIAQGLLYLHKYSRMRVIHRDLKANNILLDENMNPKISDFGMARMFKQNETEAITNRVVGTFGYMSPEYIMEGTFSIKSDIFSFGVLILEIVSGRKNSCFVHLDRTFNLIGYAWELWQQGNSLELEDITLKNTCVVQQFLRTVHVALLCVQESAADRPTTSDMISMLLNDTVSLPAPNKPAFFINRVESKSTSDESKPKHCSVNNMTITAMDGR